METENYKVLIADDEYWTRQKISRMVEWDKYHLRLLEPAVDGEDVLNRIEEEKPDILITDINMPYLSGVELLKILKEKYPDIITFVISGYDDFEYVKESFMAGSINYLVKPVSKIDLVNALSKALEIISGRLKDREEEAKNEQELLKAASLIQDREFSQLLERDNTPFTPNITMNSSLDFAGSTLILLKIHNPSGMMKKYHHDMNLLSCSLKREIRSIIRNEEVLIFNHIYRSNEFIIVTDQDMLEVRAMLDRLLIDLARITDSTVTLVISDHSYSMDSLRQAYVQTVTLLMTRPFRKKSVIVVPESGKAEIKNRFADSQMNELLALLKTNQKDEVKKLIFEEIGLGHCEEQGWEYLEVKQTVKRILNQMLEHISRQAGIGEAAAFENEMGMIDQAIEQLNGGYLTELLEEAIGDAMATGQEDTADTMKNTVRQVTGYIDENYYEELTLTLLAKRYSVESSYLSRTFKKETGDNLILYIAKVRINHARLLIEKRDVSLTEIAFMVGYDDYTYFNKVFRKLEGMSPSEYRSRCQKEQVKEGQKEEKPTSWEEKTL